MYNHGSNPTVVNCSFSGNSADYGGAMGNNGGIPTITNCTFSSNSARLAGGGMWINNSSTTVNNCILWADSAPTGVEFSLTIGSTLTVSYSDIQDGNAGVYADSGSTLNWDTGNITTDPLFVDSDGPDGNAGTEDDNLRLSPGSPCIDAGDNAVVTVMTDLDGNPRFVDGDCNDTEIADMGAYEFACACIGDFAGGCDVDFEDFSVFALAWMAEEGEPEYEPDCDISLPLDYVIDERDLKIFTDNWLAGK
jgi:hypothetical protein